MSKNTIRAVALAAVVVTAGFAGVAQAQAPTAANAAANAAANVAAPLAAPIIAVVDVQRLMQDADASKGVQSAIESQRDRYQKEITGLEEKLRSAEQELRKQQTVLSAEALGKKRKEFEQQVAEVQKTVQNRKRTLDAALNDAMGQVQKAMLEIIAEIARERGANVVLARHQFVIIDTKLDVTDTAMERLNARLPKVTVTIPK
jgi:outer membrane protein